MLFTLFIAFVSIIALMVLHEFGHFILAKKFGVRVEEFGIGYPPRLVGKKIGDTLYSINLLPFGAFVRIHGQDEESNDTDSFTKKALWKRALIILGGVISFWVIAAILLSIVMAIGVPSVINDGESVHLWQPRVQIVAIQPESPAAKAGLQVGDAIGNLSALRGDGTIDTLSTTKVQEVQTFLEAHRGTEVKFTIVRGAKTIEFSLTSRISPPAGEGPVGVALVRTALRAYPWYQAPIEGLRTTWDITVLVVQGWGYALMRLVEHKPTGAQLMGPVGIFNLFTQVSQLGVSYFFQFIAIIAINLALINLVPIPVTDGGKLLFLIIERIRGVALSRVLERRMDFVFFALLLALMIWVTIKDIQRLISGV